MIKNLCLFMIRGLPVSFFALGWPQLSVSSYLFSIFLYIHTAIRCPPRSLAHVFPNSPLQSLRGEAELTKFLTNSSGIVGAEIVRIGNLRRTFFNLN